MSIPTFISWVQLVKLLIFYFLNHYIFVKLYQTMELKHSISTVPMLLYHWSHAHLLTELVKKKVILHLPEHLLLTLGDDFTTHGFLFMATTYQFLECSSHVLNPQEPFLTYQLTSVALHGSSLHPSAAYISDLVEHIILLSKRNIPPEIMMERFTCQALGYLCIEEPEWSWFYLLN